MFRFQQGKTPGKQKNYRCELQFGTSVAKKVKKYRKDETHRQIALKKSFLVMWVIVSISKWGLTDILFNIWYLVALRRLIYGRAKTRIGPFGIECLEDSDVLEEEVCTVYRARGSSVSLPSFYDPCAGQPQIHVMHR